MIRSIMPTWLKVLSSISGSGSSSSLCRRKLTNAEQQGFSRYVHVHPELTARLQRALWEVGDAVFAPVAIHAFPRFESVSPSECALSSGYYHLPVYWKQEKISDFQTEKCVLNWRTNDQCEFHKCFQNVVTGEKNNQGEKEPSHRLPPLLHSTCTQTPQERRNMYKDRNCVFH